MCGFGSDWIDAASQADVPLPQSERPSLDRALITFVKNPELGKVKTRLARTIGDEAALAAYKHMLAHARAIALAVDCHRIVAYGGHVDPHDDWTPPQFERTLQVDGDIGERMAASIAAALGAGFRRVVLVGSDLLDLQPQHLEQAFRALQHHDFVLGPAADGGYYLVGVKVMESSIFQNKNWSTETVLSSTLEDIRRLGKTAHLLPELSDIDVEEDWRAALQRWENRQKR